MHAKQEVVPLKEDVPTAAVLDLDAEPPMADFSVKVPGDALLMTVKISRTPVTLDILARKKQPIETVNDGEYRSNVDTPGETAHLAAEQSGAGGRHIPHCGDLPCARPAGHPPPAGEEGAVYGDGFVRAKQVGRRSGTGQEAHQSDPRRAGGMRTFAVDVPEGAKALRIDLDDVSGVLDIWATHRAGRRQRGCRRNRNQHSGPQDAAVGGPSLSSGRWYVQIVRPTDVGTVDFAVYASLSAEPPPALLTVPSLAPAADARRRAIQATVDVATESGGGSGTMLAADGLILTNNHVVEAETNDAEDKEPIVIGLTLDPRQPARELFRGHVLVRDKKIDLALVDVACGLYHQPLPRGYRFPTIGLGNPDALEVGDKVTTIGFPEIANTNGWASVTLTQGVLSGFEKSEIGMLDEDRRGHQSRQFRRRGPGQSTGD